METAANPAKKATRKPTLMQNDQYQTVAGGLPAMETHM
jgi:hypothetical protein